MSKLVKALNECGPIPPWVEVVVNVPYPFLSSVATTIRKDVQVGAQDCSATSYGAYTGEIPAEMLKELGCTWVILGHSERRAYQNESSELVATKTKMALDAGLKVMVCVGETLEEREAGKIESVILGDHLKALEGKFSEKEWLNIAVAYEPVWAIGTGKTATPEQAQEVHAMIRNWVKTKVSPAAAESLRIQYGGSMKGANAAGLLAKPDIDGGLIGGAALKTEFITGIAQACPKPIFKF